MRVLPRMGSLPYRRAMRRALACIHLLVRNRHAHATRSTSQPRCRDRHRGPDNQQLGQRGSAVARGAPGLPDRRVSFSPAGENDWSRASINRPLTTGDRLWADAGARAEIQVGGAMIRMNAGTGVSILNLDDQHRPAAADAGHAECPRAPPRARPGLRGRHAEPRLYAATTRRIPDRRGSRRQRDRRSSCARARARCMERARRT